MASDDKAKTKPAPKKEDAPKSKTAPDAAPAKAEGGRKAEGGQKPDAAPSGYSRGEGQKPVTQAYKDNWNAIFGKKKR